MEDTDIIDAELTPESKLDLSEIYSIMVGISTWTKFLSIVGFVWVGFFVVLGLAFGSSMNFFGSSMSTTYPSVFFSILYFIISLLLLLPIVYLYRFSILIKRAIKSGSNKDLVNAFFNLKAHYKYIGILSIVTSVLYLFSLVGLLAGYFLRTM